MPLYYDDPVPAVLRSLRTSPDGLSETDVRARLQSYGTNELERQRRASALIIFFGQFTNFLMLLLVIAICLSLILGELLDATAMLVILLFSAFLGFVQEYRAEKAMEALEKLSAPTAKVIRDGIPKTILASKLVPGDIILLESGDIVPADARLITTTNLQTDEASLTGESLPAAKTTNTFPAATAVTERANTVFMGTIVTYGRGTAVVTTTGMKTELGRIATSIQATKESKTPLQKKFEQMARQIGTGVLALVVVVFIGGIATQKADIATMLLFSLSLAVAAVPSALPAIVTISLALGAKVLARKNMLIKKLPAAESLGAVTIICADKTGTITKNEMTATKLFVNNKIITATGVGYEPRGILWEGEKPAKTAGAELLFRTALLCNNARLVRKERGWGVQGEPTEGALVVLGMKAGMDGAGLKKQYPLVQELPFDPDRKRMSVIVENKKKGMREEYTKGAPDILLEHCTHILENGKARRLTPKDRKHILEVNTSFAEDALRVLGLAYREMPKLKEYSVASAEKGLVFVGLVGMMDPPHDEVRNAIAQCQSAGIKVMMITGDHAVTARAVAQQIGLFKEGDLILTGDEIEKMTDTELEEKIEEIRIIARALPVQKLRIVTALKKNGHVVAMTGDGVNDAPALKRADIGIAMGRTGTDVAKEVAKAVLVDDNFSTIVNAVAEGRNMYDKLIKSTRYLLSCNFGEIITVLFAIILNLPLPLVPLQILVMNLLTDGVPALGLASESSDENVMKHPPRNPKEHPLSLPTLMLIITFGVVMGIGTMHVFELYLGYGVALARTAAFTTLVMFEMFAVIGSRSLLPLHKLNPFTNLKLLLGIVVSVLIQIALVYWSPLQEIFKTVALSLNDWILILIVSSLGFIVMEAGKMFIYAREKYLERVNLKKGVCLAP